MPNIYEEFWILYTELKGLKKEHEDAKQINSRYAYLLARVKEYIDDNSCSCTKDNAINCWSCTFKNQISVVEKKNDTWVVSLMEEL